MAKKLSDEAKALVKEATRLRNQAYTKRRKAYQKALDEALAAVEQSPVAAARKAADDDLEKVREEKTAARDVIQRKIEELQRELALEQSRFDAVIQEKRAVRDRGYAAWRAATTEAEAKVKAEFPDMHIWSAAAWKPYQEFLPQVKSA